MYYAEYFLQFGQHRTNLKVKSLSVGSDLHVLGISIYVTRGKLLSLKQNKQLDCVFLEFKELTDIHSSHYKDSNFFCLLECT